MRLKDKVSKLVILGLAEQNQCQLKHLKMEEAYVDTARNVILCSKVHAGTNICTN